MKYTSKQLEFLRINFIRLSVRDLTVAFNMKFKTEINEGQIRSTLRNHSIKSGRTGQFEKGRITWNKGIKGYMGANVTSFKKGNIPRNITRIGTERLSKDGYIEIKIKERNPYTKALTRYKLKHIHIWEKKHGPVPKGHALIFKDGNKLNIDNKNLLLITRAELLSLNLHKYHESPAELKPTILILAKLETKAGIRLRPSRGQY